MQILAIKNWPYKTTLYLTLSATLLSGCDGNDSVVVVAPPDEAALLIEVKSISTPVHSFTPSYTFFSSADGTIIYGGDCSSASTTATQGINTITFDPLPNGPHSNCTIAVQGTGSLISSTLNISAFTVEWLTKPLNDTGVVSCADYAFGASLTHNNALDCATQPVVATQQEPGTDDAGGDTIPAGQDALYGRDVTFNDDSDGHAGFSFTKLDVSGAPLTNQNIAWDPAGSEAANSQWSCVKDNVTGLIWEVKTNNTTPDLRDSDWTYSWYSQTNNAGKAGTEDGADNCSDITRCDTEKYAIDVNALNICGETTDDWRVPSRHELFSIVSHHRNTPSIDINYFPNTLSNTYWTSETHAAIYFTSAWSVQFQYGYMGISSKISSLSVRLVRDSQ